MYSHQSATILSQICCHDGVLPQGAPTSPLISNIICWKLDAQLQNLARNERCSYTRYVDDITFSFSIKKELLPTRIVKFSESGDPKPGFALEKIIRGNGFLINTDKTRLQGRSQRQEVTGITTNLFNNVKREFIRKTASMIYSIKKFGLVLAESHFLSQYCKNTLSPWLEKQIRATPGAYFFEVVKGRINYIKMVRGAEDLIYRKLTYRLTEALGEPNVSFKYSVIEKAIFILKNLIGNEQGTGFYLDKVGLVTNQHVADNIDENNDELLLCNRYYEPNQNRAVGYIDSSKGKDIAIFQPGDDFRKITPLKSSGDQVIRIGDRITIVGFPDNENQESIFKQTGRVVSEISRFNEQVWIVDTPIIHGLSGAPVFNDKEEVIGVATFGSKVNSPDASFSGFIPVSVVEDFCVREEFEQKKLMAQSKLVKKIGN